ncbi:MAG: cytochrome c biogenesis heme-transporting ATPase CcmA [Thiotrichales bacterium]|nr:cytochrome c biogenesis heme-transporting ATPase CcmA [Thiotrichales bacterium]MCY4348958.1 cytochrome c biogenesis heme-transporting ATPase CcmA [Thiotrichales bacterium]
MPQTELHRDRNPLLEAVDLSCSRGHRTLFENLALQVSGGEVVQILGANGSGKTTLLRVLCGLQPPAAGSLRWRGRDMSPGAPEVYAEVQFIGHAGGVKLDLTPRENLDVAIALGGRPTGTTVATALARLGIGKFGRRPVRTLSVGQRQRVALARLLTCASLLWVLDEPFTALDADGVSIVDAMLYEHIRAGGAAIITSHHPVALGRVTPRPVSIDAGA